MAGQRKIQTPTLLLVSKNGKKQKEEEEEGKEEGETGTEKSKKHFFKVSVRQWNPTQVHMRINLRSLSKLLNPWPILIKIDRISHLRCLE